MEPLYAPSQQYGVYEQQQHQQWAEDSKAAFMNGEHGSMHADKGLDGVHMVNSSSMSGNRRPSALKVEDELPTNTTPTPVSCAQMWHERSHDAHPVRSFSTSHAPTINTNGPPFVGMHDPTFTIHHAHTWSVPHSGISTPTPLYGQVYEMQYGTGPHVFAPYDADPAAAVSMSPQSSQGGWASAASSDGHEHRGLISPTFRPASSGTVVRPDGIRKKNARFEIPKERNLANIDAMILASTDEGEKKELKQQKRLLRNRQAALDSRQRKKTHTEKLEQEKKVTEKKMFDMEEALARMENTLALEREQFLQQRHHMENLIHNLQYDRDEAIRSKTVETAELRRQNNLLKDCVRDLERQQHKGYAPVSQTSHYNGDFSDFGLADNWDDEFDMINNEDLKMHESDMLHRQATPKPTNPTSKSTDFKADVGFSLSTFYMCLLFGAFIASNSNSTNMDNNAASVIASSIPPTEANNVIKSVLSSGTAGGDGLSTRADGTTNGIANNRNTAHPTYLETNPVPPSSLDHLHQSLSTPSRRQEMAAAFSMSASSYQHLTDPFHEHLNGDTNHDLLEQPATPQPSALQRAFASIQAQRDNIDRITGMGSKARERSLLWDQVPPEVIKNFEALVQSNANSNNNKDVESMEQ